MIVQYNRELHYSGLAHILEILHSVLQSDECKSLSRSCLKVSIKGVTSFGIDSNSYLKPRLGELFAATAGDSAPIKYLELPDLVDLELKNVSWDPSRFKPPFELSEMILRDSSLLGGFPFESLFKLESINPKNTNFDDSIIFPDHVLVENPQTPIRLKSTTCANLKKLELSHGTRNSNSGPQTALPPFEDMDFPNLGYLSIRICDPQEIEFHIKNIKAHKLKKFILSASNSPSAMVDNLQVRELELMDIQIKSLRFANTDDIKVSSKCFDFTFNPEFYGRIINDDLDTLRIIQNLPQTLKFLEEATQVKISHYHHFLNHLNMKKLYFSNLRETPIISYPINSSFPVLTEMKISSDSETTTLPALNAPNLTSLKLFWCSQMKSLPDNFHDCYPKLKNSPLEGDR